MADYTYQGDDVDIAGWEANFTSRFGDGSGDSEQAYQQAVQIAAACKSGGQFLDVGSGHGRIINWLRPHAGWIIGLEPDTDRFRSCLGNFSDYGNIKILNATTATLLQAARPPRFDLIVVSMVVQHVSTATCLALFGDVRELLAEQGVAIVSTTHFPHERFTYQNDPSPKDASQFDAYADHSSAQEHGLPVRFFSRDSFVGALRQAGLKVVVWQQFSYPKPERAEGLAGLYQMPPHSLRDSAFSQFALVVPDDR